MANMRYVLNKFACVLETQFRPLLYKEDIKIIWDEVYKKIWDE